MSGGVSACAYCRAEISEDRKVCEDAKACSARVAKRVAPEISRLVTKPFVGFDPDEAYRNAEKGSA